MVENVIAATSTVRRCRSCGCTETRACRDQRQGRPCHWVGPDLCRACGVDPFAAETEQTVCDPRR